MSEPRKVLGEFISYEEKEFYGVTKYVISYKQPHSSDPAKIWKHQAAEDDLSEKATAKLVELSAGERFCVHQDKDDKGYPVIVSLSDAKDAPEKKTQGTYQKKGGNYTPKDDSGIAVGAAYTNAIEILRIAGVVEKNIDKLIELVDEVAAKVLVNKLAQEAKLKASKAAAAKEEPKAEEKKKSKAELLKEKKAAEAKAEPVKAKAKKEPDPEPPLEEEDSVEIEDDDLDDVQF